MKTYIIKNFYTSKMIEKLVVVNEEKKKLKKLKRQQFKKK